MGKRTAQQDSVRLAIRQAEVRADVLVLQVHAELGCIRVDQPLALAERLLDDPATWNQARIAEVIQSQETQTVYLRQPLPVLLLYWTAMVETDAQVHFMPDVYDRDAAILEDLNAAFRLRQRDVERR